MESNKREWPDRIRPSTHHLVDKRGRANVLFVTVCTWNKEPLLEGPLECEALCRAWTEADAWLVGRFVIMPDHVHFFCSPNSGHPLSAWMRYWKRLATQRWPKILKTRLWEPNFWDTQIRNAQAYNQKWDYVLQNPVRAGLAAHAEEWPFQGELCELDWR